MKPRISCDTLTVHTMPGSHAIRCEGNTVYFRVRGCIDESDIQTIIDLGDHLGAQYGQFWILLYAQEMTTITTEARRLAVNSPNLRNLGGGAIIGASLANRTILTLINRAMNLLGGAHVRSTFVQTEAEAKDWLAAQQPTPPFS